MQYDLVVAGTHTDFVKFVNKKLQEGWKLHGSPIMCDWNCLHFAQAMIKETDMVITKNEIFKEF